VAVKPLICDDEHDGGQVGLTSAEELQKSDRECDKKCPEWHQTAAGYCTDQGTEPALLLSGELQGHLLSMSMGGTSGITEGKDSKADRQETEDAVEPASNGTEPASAGDNPLQAKAGKEVGTEDTDGKRTAYQENPPAGPAAENNVGDEKEESGKGTGIDAIDQTGTKNGTNGKRRGDRGRCLRCCC